MTPSEEQGEAAPREPEIELLGKLARGFLFAARAALAAAGVASLAFGLVKSLTDGASWQPGELVWRAEPSAAGAVWVTLGLPLVLPAATLLRRGGGQVALLLASAALWFGPSSLEDDSDYGYILRIFATLVSFLCLVVWRTLWRLTGTGLPRGGSEPTL
jgi:hypothetical protein